MKDLEEIMNFLIARQWLFPWFPRMPHLDHPYCVLHICSLDDYSKLATTAEKYFQ